MTTFLMSSRVTWTEAQRQLSAAGFEAEKGTRRPGEKGEVLVVDNEDRDAVKVKKIVLTVDATAKTRHDM